MKKLKKWSAGILAGILLVSSAGTVMADSSRRVQNPSMVTLQTNRTYKQFDVTGDGKADKLTLRVDPSYSGLIAKQGSFQVFINGKKALTWKDAFYKGDATGQYDVKLCTVNPEDIFLFVRGKSETDHYNAAKLFRYEKGKMKDKLDLKKIYKNIFLYREAMDVKKVTEAGLWFQWYGQAGVTGALNWTVPVSWNGYKFYRPGKTCQVSEKDRARQWTAVRTFSVYRTAALEETSFLVKKGETVKITGVYNHSKRLFVRVVNQKGQYGWVPCPNETSGYFKESVYVG